MLAEVAGGSGDAVNQGVLDSAWFGMAAMHALQICWLRAATCQGFWLCNALAHSLCTLIL